MRYVKLNEAEEQNLETFLSRREVKRFLDKGSELALVYSMKNGIGRSVQAVVHDGNYLTMISKDITDYKIW